MLSKSVAKMLPIFGRRSGSLRRNPEESISPSLYQPFEPNHSILPMNSSKLKKLREMEAWS
jgi:hypothetical protein